jgi:tight adherence protein C
MTETGILLALFGFVTAAVTAAGYYFVVKPEMATHEDATTREILANTLQSLGEALPAQNGGESIRRRLMAAGYRTASAPYIFSGITYTASAVLALTVFSVVAVFQDSLMDALIPGLCGAGFGYFLPKRILEMMIRRRVRRISAGLATALDLLVLSVEAGQALDQAIAEASREIRRAFPDLADELAQVYLALRASATRSEVFREFGERNDDMELRKLANVLIDSDRFGTSLGPTLRTHARYVRIRRRQAAQEMARKVSVKLVFPIFFLIFPSVLLVTLGPAVMQIATAFGTLTKMP